MSEGLHPCPFCGGEAFMKGASEPWSPGGQHTNGPNWLMVGCKSCMIYFSECDARDHGVRHVERRDWPVRMWNRRTK